MLKWKDLQKKMIDQDLDTMTLEMVSAKRQINNFKKYEQNISSFNF